MRQSLEEACKLAGGQTALAEKIGRNQKFIWHLLYRAETINADVAFKIADATGIAVRDIVADFDSNKASQ